MTVPLPLEALPTITAVVATPPTASIVATVRALTRGAAELA
jgi:hypothetical protein